MNDDDKKIYKVLVRLIYLMWILYLSCFFLMKWSLFYGYILLAVISVITFIISRFLIAHIEECRDMFSDRWNRFMCWLIDTSYKLQFAILIFLTIGIFMVYGGR